MSNNTRRTSWSRWLGALGLVAVLCSWGCTVGCSVGNSDAKTFENGAKDEKRKEEAVPVEVAALGHGEIEAVLRLSSNLEAEGEVQVFAEAPRRVTQLLVEEGTPVRKGQILIQLQDDEQKSAVAKAEIELKESERDYDRTKELYEQKLVTEQLFNEAGYKVERNRLALDDARRELGYTQVRAPIDGVVTERLVNLGDHVTVNQPLFRIVDFDSIVARIYVPEKDMVRLAVGQPARLRADALGGKTFTGVDRPDLAGGGPRHRDDQGDGGDAPAGGPAARDVRRGRAGHRGPRRGAPGAEAGAGLRQRPGLRLPPQEGRGAPGRAPPRDPRSSRTWTSSSPRAVSSRATSWWWPASPGSRTTAWSASPATPRRPTTKTPRPMPRPTEAAPLVFPSTIVTE